MNLFNFNYIFSNIGIIDISFLGFLKIIFFIFFIVLNIVLLYCDYKDTKYKNKNSSNTPLQSGLGPEIQTLRNATKQFIIATGLMSSLITINSEFFKKSEKEKEAQATIVAAKEAMARAESTLRQAQTEKAANNLATKLHMQNINRSFGLVTNNKKEQSELRKAIAEINVQ